MTQRGKVIGLKDDLAQVAIVRQSACASDCSKCGGCAVHESKQMMVWARNLVDARYGDVVELFTPDSQFLNKAALTYLLPACCFLLGMIVPLGFGLNELQSALIGASLLVLSIFGIVLYDHRLRKSMPMPEIRLVVFPPRMP